MISLEFNQSRKRHRMRWRARILLKKGSTKVSRQESMCETSNLHTTPQDDTDADDSSENKKQCRDGKRLEGHGRWGDQVRVPRDQHRLIGVTHSFDHSFSNFNHYTHFWSSHRHLIFNFILIIRTILTSNRMGTREMFYRLEHQYAHA
jgi:hypothetical protein